MFKNGLSSKNGGGVDIKKDEAETRRPAAPINRNKEVLATF